MDIDLLLPDVLRKLENLVRTGTIAEVRHELPGALVRVRTGNNVTDWRPYHELRAGNTRTWNPPTVGEQVTLLSPGGDLAGALVIGGIHQNDHPAPSTDPNKTVTVYPDGATVSYDHAAHALVITLPGGGTADITVPDRITVICKTADVTASDSATLYAKRVTARCARHRCQRQLAGAEDSDVHAGNGGNGRPGVAPRPSLKQAVWMSAARHQRHKQTPMGPHQAGSSPIRVYDGGYGGDLHPAQGLPAGDADSVICGTVFRKHHL